MQLQDAASDVSFVRGGVWRKREGGRRPVGKEMLGKAPRSGRETGGAGGKRGSDARQSDGGDADGKKTQRRIKRTSVRRAVPVQNFSFFSRREVKGVDMLSGCN